MKYPIVFIFGGIAMLGTALGAGSHSGGHDQETGHSDSDDHHDMMAVGMPGETSNVSRTIEVTMQETEEGDMVFSPVKIEVSEGETIRFTLINIGDLEHEFVLDDHQGVMEHKMMMQNNSAMGHEDPNSIRLDSGQSGQVIWNFVNQGSFEFACLIPGHYDAGMKGTIEVSGTSATN